ncbi:hypothetical protein ILUMI_13854 [Ignelater luminosus]|uniref:Reverse transcriptase domain-containing protein n=1 Tax=Ignelater luminosus TaxID=2038154 RepID=A0A8K0CX09_IGNLU|nr:hypothetical protein ILUMI_13854 [Ignelater luminosus]
MWKRFDVIPVPKVFMPKTHKDSRPISILPVFSKIFEKQSGSRQRFSCTTALLNVHDDILTAANNNRVTVLVLLDFSKVFDIQSFMKF